MFGYIKPFKPDLRFCEYDIYKAAYCSLCKSLGKNYGFLPQLLLNYDFAFLSLVSLSLFEQQPCLFKGKCRCNPLKKCLYLNGYDQSFDRISAAVVISVYHKLSDDTNDDKGPKRLYKIIVRRLLKRAYKKAGQSYPDIVTAAAALTERQTQAEQQDFVSIDRLCEPSSEFLSSLAGLTCSEELSSLGYHLGRWIYLIDCADDLFGDIKSGRYNPLICSFGSDTKAALEYVNKAIERTQIQLCYEYDRIKFKRYDQIIGNVIFEGLPFVKNRVFADIRKKHGSKKERG